LKVKRFILIYSRRAMEIVIRSCSHKNNLILPARESICRRQGYHKVADGCQP